MSSVRITIHPEILQWARERRGFAIEEPARRLDVSSERLRQWEAGEEGMTSSEIIDVARLYRISPAAFFLADVPAEDSSAPGSEERIIGNRPILHLPPPMMEGYAQLTDREDRVRLHTSRVH